MPKSGWMWIGSLLVLILLSWSLMLASPVILLGTMVYENIFGEPVDAGSAK
jgi:hypothetical protein